MYKRPSLMKISILTFTIFLFFVTNINALFCENYNSDIKNLDEEQWYTLFAPQDSFTTYLLNYNKEVVHTWQSNYFPGHSAYLLENGNLLHTNFLGAHPVFLSGGMGGGVQEVDWNGSVAWDFKYSGDTYLSHHDVKRLPNGNTLMIAWELKNNSEAVSAGRNPQKIPQLGLWPDHVIEVKTTSPTSGEIVWEWHVWDHLIQDFDPSKENYGIVGDHPELIDINFGKVASDWNHMNSIDYNEEFDQILLSVHNFNEIWVIDHSTTTEEAAGHSGGNSGKGGDILYRWGNPVAYRAGTKDDQMLFGQHDARWIRQECPGQGNILIFNNGLGRPGALYSSIDEIVPPVDGNGSYYLEPGAAYGPIEKTWIYTAQNPTDFYAYMISGAQRLSNGNTMICDGKKGVFFEVTMEKNTVWQYTNPYPNQFINTVFKIETYPSNFSGLENLFQQPNKPERPTGNTNGGIRIEYNYTSVTTDPQDDQIYYLFDWDDKSNSGWIGPLNSGETVNASHAWDRSGSFHVKVKAKDIYGHESDWSEPLSIKMPRSQEIGNPIFWFIYEHKLLSKIMYLFF